MFVTLNKDSLFASPLSTRIMRSADLFHWESPNNWRQHTNGLLRCIGGGLTPPTPVALRARAEQRGC